ncbi:UNVERIFIED_CONTAM: hypothetical protein FKN15_039432 [Acipenser sinensis]
MDDLAVDSDDEVDYSKMDQGNKKGPLGRWDFDTQEEYSDYMNNKEALPKAAFQYCIKMSEGRKTRRFKETNEKAELDRQWKKISAVLGIPVYATVSVLRMDDLAVDSDDEVDYSKMDQGNKKGPLGRWDFDTQEEYSDYMNNKEALPKAAFQYGIKMSEGRKTRRFKETNEKAELDRQWKKISAGSSEETKILKTPTPISVNIFIFIIVLFEQNKKACSALYLRMDDLAVDSDDEVDYSKMDQGNKKGPLGRWDFDTQEEYSDYMNNKEALPKAAFQYGIKMSEGRKTRRFKETNEKAELDRQWKKISAVIVFDK